LIVHQKIVWNLNYYQSISKIMYLFFLKKIIFILEFIIKIIKIIHCQVIPTLNILNIDRYKYRWGRLLIGLELLSGLRSLLDIDFSEGLFRCCQVSSVKESKGTKDRKDCCNMLEVVTLFWWGSDFLSH
jgi:hypothetical protein